VVLDVLDALGEAALVRVLALFLAFREVALVLLRVVLALLLAFREAAFVLVILGLVVPQVASYCGRQPSARSTSRVYCGLSLR
jgi:hypothetical protein